MTPLPPFTENMRHDLQHLNPGSLILDVGAYEGNWARIVCEKYSCEAILFEPVPQFFEAMKTALAGHPHRNNMELHNLGVGAESGERTFKVKGDMSGIMADSGPEVRVKLIGIVELLQGPGLFGRDIDCLKLNIENSEYEVLEALLDSDRWCYVQTLHVQWHSGIPFAETRRAAIERNLELHGYRRLWERGAFDNGWDGWTKRRA